MSQEYTSKNRPKIGSQLYDLEKVLGKLIKWHKGFEKKFANFDAQEWWEENVYENWTWEGMLEKFIKKELLGE